MKVLIYAEHFYPSVGGVEHSSRLIAEYLSQQGTQVTVVTKTLEEGDRIFPFQTVRDPSRKQLHLLINESDLVYLNGMGLGILLYAKLKHKKVVMTYRDLTMVCPKGTKWMENEPCMIKASIRNCVPCLRRSEHRKKWFIRLVRPILKTCFSAIIDANVCTSTYGYDNFQLFKKRLIQNAINAENFVPLAAKPNNTIPNVLFVGRLEPEKGCQILLYALAGLKKEGIRFQGIICGDGMAKDQLLEMRKTLKIEEETHFVGIKTGEDLVKTIQSADIAVVPSLIEEPFGLVAIEAMSCELPVIAANVGGLGPNVAEVGLIYERNDVDGLIKHLKTLTNDPVLRSELGKKGRKAVLAKYDSDLMASNYHKLFKDLCQAQQIKNVS